MPRVRVGVVVLAALLAVPVLAAQRVAGPVTMSLTSVPLTQAVVIFSRHTGLEVLYDQADGGREVTVGISAQPAEQALASLAAAAGLQVLTLADGRYLLVDTSRLAPAPSLRPPAPPPPGQPPAEPEALSLPAGERRVAEVLGDLERLAGIHIMADVTILERLVLVPDEPRPADQWVRTFAEELDCEATSYPGGVWLLRRQRGRYGTIRLRHLRPSEVAALLAHPVAAADGRRVWEDAHMLPGGLVMDEYRAQLSLAVLAAPPGEGWQPLSWRVSDGRTLPGATTPAAAAWAMKPGVKPIVFEPQRVTLGWSTLPVGLGPIIDDAELDLTRDVFELRIRRRLPDGLLETRLEWTIERGGRTTVLGTELTLTCGQAALVTLPSSAAIDLGRRPALSALGTDATGDLPVLRILADERLRFRSEETTR